MSHHDKELDTGLQKGASMDQCLLNELVKKSCIYPDFRLKMAMESVGLTGNLPVV